MKVYWVTAIAMLALMLGVGLVSQPDAEQAPIESPLATQEVVRRMVSLTARRHQALRSYTAMRHYHLDYHGLGREVADMDVRVRYDAPGPKQLTVISESGSGMLRDHVLDPLIKREKEEAEIESQTGSVFVPENYAFTLVDYPHPGGQPDYVLAVQPRKNAQHRFLFKGKIWLDPNDFGMIRAEGRSVHSPSFWISHFDFVYRGQRLDGFWLPATNRTVAHLRLFGHAVLDITYTDFNLISFHALDFVAQGAPQ
jgi:hypothetical protein